MNMTPKFILNVFLFIGLSVQAQWMEKFDYSDWNTQLNWQGDVKSFTIDNERLRSNNDSANVEFYISRSLQLYSEMVWEFWINLKFNTSSANYLDVYLFSDSMNLKGQKNGYFVRIGNTKDEIALYKSKAGSAPTILIDGRDNITAGSNNILKVKVERNVLGQWNLYSDLDATGNYFHEGFVVDSSFIDAKYFGLLVKQSTASFFKKHFIENIYTGAPVRDTLSPYLVQFNVVTDTALLFQFTEAVKPIVDSVPCFKIVGVPVLVESFRKDSVFIQLGKKLTNFVNYQFAINNLQDLNGNSFSDTSISFLFSNPETPQLKQILITEIMADPDPSVNLPNAEYIELLNRHTFPIQLKGSILSDPTRTVVFPEFIIKPGEYVVICDNNHVSSFSAYGRVLGVTGLPSLNNASDEILIRNKFGDLVHKVN